MKIKHILLSLAAAMVLSGGGHAASQADYHQAVAEAKASLKAAAGNEWRDSGKLLKKADAAARAGDFDKAVKLAQAARLQGTMAQQQAVEQANAGNPSYLY